MMAYFEVNRLNPRIQRFLSFHLKEREEGLKYFQERIFLGIIVTSILATTFAYLPSVFAAYEKQLWDIIILDTVLLIWAFFLFFKPQLTYKFRSNGLIYGVYILSLYLLIKLGPYGAGALWLFIFPILSILFQGFRSGICSLILSIFSILLVLIFERAGYINWQLFTADNELTWVVITGNFILLVSVVTISTGIIIQGLENTLKDLKTRVNELSLTQQVTIDCLASLAEFNNPETGKHIRRTRNYIRLLSEQLLDHPKYRGSLDTKQVTLLVNSSPLHDIGKVGVPDHILNKPGKLTPDEYDAIKKHTVYGRDILMKPEQTLGSTSFLKMAKEMAYSHQERWDGSGYPLGLKKEHIPLSGRLMAIADVYDALRSKRVYKKAYSHQEAVKIIKRGRGIQFDPDIVDVFLNVETEFETIAKKV